jgi:lipid-A-disaccharide synthase
MKAMVKVPFIAMPNILAERELMPEFLQRKAQPRMLSEALENWRNSPQRIEEFERRCREIHTTLRTDASVRAATAILEIVGCDA